jgi:hypothetical protein
MTAGRPWQVTATPIPFGDDIPPEDLEPRTVLVSATDMLQACTLSMSMFTERYKGDPDWDTHAWSMHAVQVEEGA